jgi:hypothetical protein
MPRVNSVKKARKSAGKCDKCGKDIKKGDPYKWWKFRYGGKHKRCAKCPYPRASELTQSDKLSRLYGAGENIQDAISAFEGDYDVESLRSTLEEAANDVREVGEEYQESASNMEEYFQGSSQVDELNEKGENCESKADEIESAAGDLEEFDEDSGNIDVPNITEEV